MSKSKSFTLGGKALPVDLHNVCWVETDAEALTLGDTQVAFDFNYHLIRFACRLDQVEGKAHLKLAGDLGPMPYSAESTVARLGLTRIIEAGNEALGDSRFRLVQGRVVLGGDLVVPVPVSAVGLVTEASRFLVPSLPYLDLIAIYLRPPLAPPSRPGDPVLQPEWRKTKARGR